MITPPLSLSGRRAARAAMSAMIALALSGGCDEETVSPGIASDGKSSGDAIDGDATSAPAGMGKPCKQNADCKSAGLTCFLVDESSNTKICSKVCQGAADCGGITQCNPVTGVLICTLPRYCNPCSVSADCGPSAPQCVHHPDKPSDTFCSQTCQTGDGSCPAGSSCVQFGDGAKDFACMPDYGSCTGGGEHCSPCKSDVDCGEGTECLQASDVTERFCARLCDPAGGGTGCPIGFKCTKYGDKGYCYQIVGKDDEGKTITYPTCAKGDKGFCDACQHDWECLSKRCVTKNNESFCAQPNPCTKGGEADDCPYGGRATYCVSSNKGMVCAPPLAHHCHGFKACLHALCGPDETCNNGLCKAKSP